MKYMNKKAKLKKKIVYVFSVYMLILTKFSKNRAKEEYCRWLLENDLAGRGYVYRNADQPKGRGQGNYHCRYEVRSIIKWFFGVYLY